MGSEMCIRDSADPITSNWEVVDSDGYGTLGTGMSLSSGVFTFPSTGIYLITLNGYGVATSLDNIFFQVKTTTDNSTYDIAATVAASSGNAGNYQNSNSSQFIFDVTDTTTHKCRFRASSLTSPSYWRGNTGFNATHVTFIRLGDT